MNIYQLADQFHKNLGQQDARTARVLIDGYFVVQQRILAEYAALGNKIQAAQAAGAAVSPSWLLQQQRFEKFLQQVDFQVAQYAAFAGTVIGASKQNFVQKAMQNTQALLQAQSRSPGQQARVSASFSTMKVEALQAAVAFTTDGPLKNLLSTLAPSGWKAAREALIRGVGLGYNAKQIAGELAQSLSIPPTRALRIARTETMRAYREANRLIYQENEDMIVGWRWNASMSRRTCPVCYAMHGKIFPAKTRMATHVNCRCIQIPVTREWEELGFDGVQNPPLPNTDGEARFAKLSPSEQQEILGKAKFEAFQQGKISLQNLVGIGRHPEWGEFRFERNLKDSLLGVVPGAVPGRFTAPPLASPLFPISKQPPVPPAGTPQFAAWQLNQKPLVTQQGQPDPNGQYVESSLKGLDPQVFSDLLKAAQSIGLTPSNVQGIIRELNISTLQGRQRTLLKTFIDDAISSFSFGKPSAVVWVFQGKRIVISGQAHIEAAQLFGLSKARVRVFDLDKALQGPAPPKAKGKPGAAFPNNVKNFPAGIDTLQVVKSLGGSTGAQLVQDPATGKLYVLKRGSSPDHLLEEDLADRAYRALGVRVPSSKIYSTPNGPVKLSEFIEGETLSTVLQKGGALATKVKQDLKNGFAADALMGNWDVIGLALDNVLIDTKGQVWRIDNGGSLRYRAQGRLKTTLPDDGVTGKPADWDGYALDLWTMRNPKFGTAAQIFGDLDFFEVADQVMKLLPNQKAFLKELPPSLKSIAQNRLALMQDVADLALKMKTDKWNASYVDEMAKHYVGLHKWGLLARLPKVMSNTPGQTSLVDEHGTDFDRFRGKDSHATFLSEYMKKVGGRYEIWSDFADSQGGSSYAENALAAKEFWIRQRSIPHSKYYYRFGEQSQLAAFNDKMALYGAGTYANTWAVMHAFSIATLKNVRFRYNDRAKGVVRLIRTEGGYIKSSYSIKLGPGNVILRGAHESASIFKTVFATAGSEITVQEVPYWRITSFYFLARHPGTSLSPFYGDSENEFIFLPEGIPFQYLGQSTLPSTDDPIPL